MIRLMLWCLLGIGVWFIPTNVWAQDPPDSAERNETVIRKTPLDVIVLANPDGNREIRLFGSWPMIVFDDLYRALTTDREQQGTPYTIRNVSATGTVLGNYVEARIKIEIVTSTDRQVRVPLGFKEGILPGDDQPDSPSFCYTGTGSASITIDPQEGHFVAVITPKIPQASDTEDSDNLDKPEVNQPHMLSLLLRIPLAPNDGKERRLSLSFPLSNSSLFMLEIPMLNIDASATRGFIFDVQENVERQSTSLQIQGLRPDTEVVWEKKKEEIVDDRPVLHVEKAAIDVRLDVRSTIYDAVLPIRSETGSFDQLQIRLPQGSVLDRDTNDRYAAANNYSIEEVSSDSIVTIRFPQKTTGPVSLHLRALQQFEGDTSDSSFRRDLAGFEVLDAERQSGFLTVSVSPAELKPHWEMVRGIRRPEGGISNISTGDSRFEFISQPFLLHVRAMAPQIRITVKPDYQFRISRGELMMDARLSYTVSGAKTDVLYLFLSDSQWHGWDFGTSSIVDTARVDLDESGTLMIPLHSQREGTIDIGFRVYRTIDVEDERRHRLVLPIPRPQLVTWSESAPVTIVSANNVEILPIEESSSATTEQHSRGLTLQSRRIPIRLPLTDMQQDPLVYRTDLSDSVFVADLTFRQQRISASMQTDVRLMEESNQVKQTISYKSAFASVNRITVLLPQSLNTNGDVQVQGDNNRPLELRDTISDPRDSVPDGWVRKVIQLPEPTFQCQLTFLYPPPPLIVATDETVPFSLPFICPEVPVTEHRIHFVTPTGYRVELHPEAKQHWESYREPRRPPSSSTETFRSVQLSSKITLFVSASERSILGTTIVERAWLQTWLTGTTRRDLATYLLRSANDSVTLQLPRDSMRERPVIVLVDRESIQPNISPTGTLTIPILPEQYNRPIEVSVDYRYTFKMSSMEVSLPLPFFSDETLVQYKFWQVILPQSMHIIGNPTGWTLGYDWSWNGLFWWRVPSIRKSDIGFEPDDPATESIISESSQYVFSHLQPPPLVTLYIVKRSWIILCASSIALFIGLVLIYIPQSRYVGSLFGLGVVLLAVLFYQPPLALLTLQAAAFGVFLALGTGYIYRIFHRQKQWIPPAFPMFEDVSQPFVTPVPVSQTVHEVVLDSESASKDVEQTVANPNEIPPNGAS